MTDKRRVHWGHAGAIGAAAGLFLLLLAGCGGKSSSAAAPEATLAPPAAYFDAIEVRAAALREQANDLATLAGTLPGNDDSENRELFGRAFTQLTPLLLLMAGPDAGGPFDHQLSVVQLTRIRLAGDASPRAMQAYIDNGLAAGYNALVEASRMSYYRDANITASLAQLRAKIEELDQASNAAHGVVAAQAVKQIAGIAQTMASALLARIADPTAPSTAPSEEAAPKSNSPSDAKPQATEPAATEPVTAPSTPAPESAAPDKPAPEPGVPAPAPEAAPAPAPEPGAPAPEPGAPSPAAEPAPAPGPAPEPGAPAPSPGPAPAPTPDSAAPPAAPPAPAPGEPAPAPAPPEINK